MGRGCWCQRRRGTLGGMGEEGGTQVKKEESGGAGGGGG